MRSGARFRDEQAQKSPAILRGGGRDASQDLQGEDTPEVSRHRVFAGTPRQATPSSSSQSQQRGGEDELSSLVTGPDFAAMWDDLGTEFFDGEEVEGQASPSVSHAVNAAANLAVNEATAALVQTQNNSAQKAKKDDLAREGRPVSVELFGDDDDDDDQAETRALTSEGPSLSSEPVGESLSPEKKVEMEMMQLLRAATQYGQAEVDDQAKAQEERFHFEVRKAIAKSTKAAAAIRADAEAAKTGDQPTVRLRDLDAAASLASAFDEDDFETGEVQARQRRASSGVVDNIVAAIGPNSDPHRKKRKVNRKKRVQSPALAAKVAAMEKAKADKAKLAAGADGETQALDANKLTEDNKLAWNVVAAVTHHAAHMEAEKKAKANSKDNPHNWACKVCTYRNVTTNDILTTCQMCGTKAPGLLYTPEAPEYACLSTMYLYKFFAADWKLFDAFRHEEGLATLQAEADSKWYGDLDKARFNLRLSVARSLANSLAILVQSSASLEDDECQFDPKRFLTEVYFTGKKKRAPGSPSNAAADDDGGGGGDEKNAPKDGQVDVFGGPLNVANVIVASKDWGVFVPRHLCPGTVVEVYFPALAVNVTAVVEQLHCTRKFAYVMRIVKPSAYATIFEAVVDHARGIMWIKQAAQHVVLCLAGASKYSVVIGAGAADAVAESSRARGIKPVTASGGGGAKSSGTPPADSPGGREDGSAKRKKSKSKKSRRKQPKRGFDCILCAAANKARRIFTKAQRAVDASGADSAPKATSVEHSSKVVATIAQSASAADREQQEVEAAIRAVEDAKKQDEARAAAAAVAKQQAQQKKQAELAAAEALMEEAVKEARAEKARKAEAARQAKLKQQHQKQERQEEEEREKREKERAAAEALEAQQQAHAREVQEAKKREEQEQEQEAKVRAEQEEEAKVRAEQEQEAKALAEQEELRARAQEAARAVAEQEAKAKAAAEEEKEAKALALAAEAKAKADQEAEKRAAAEAAAAAERARAEDERAEKEAEAIAKAEAEARVRAAARAKAIAEAEARAKAEAEATAAREAEAKAKAEAEAAAKREDEARRAAEAEMEAEAAAAARIAEARAKLELIRTAEQRQAHAGSGVIGRLRAAKQDEEERRTARARDKAAQAKAKLAQIRTAEQRAKRTGSGTTAAWAAKARQEAEQKAAQSEKALKGLYSDVSSFAVLRGMEQLQAMAASKSTQQQVEAKAQMYYDGNINRAQRAFNVGLKDMFDHLANAIRQATSKVDETFEKTVKLDVMHDKSPAARARSLQIAKRNFVQAVTQKLARKFLQVLIGNFHKNSHAGGSSDDDDEESDRSNNGRGARIRELLARRKSKKFVSSDSSYSDDEQESLPRDHSRPASWSAPPGSRDNSPSPKNRRAANSQERVESQAADATDDSEESNADGPASDSLGQAASSPQTWEEPPSTDDEEVEVVDVSVPQSAANRRTPVRSAAALLKAQNAEESVFIASSDSSDEGEDGDDEQPSSLQSANGTARRSPAGKGSPNAQNHENADVEDASGDSTDAAISRSSSSSSSSSQNSTAVSPRQDGLRETNEGLPEMCQGDPATWDLATASAAFAAFAETCVMASDDEEPSLPNPADDASSPAEVSKEPDAAVLPVAGGEGQGLVRSSGAQQADNSPDPKGSGEDNDNNVSVAKPRIQRKSARNDGRKEGGKGSRSKSRIARISSSGSSSADEKAKRDRHASPAQRAKAAKSALASQGDDDVIERTIAQIIKSPQAHEIIKLEANEHFDGDFDRALRMFLSSLRRESESFHEAKRKSLKNLEKRLATEEGKKILQDEAQTRFGGDLTKAKAFMVRVVSQQVRERQKNFAQRALVNFRVAAKLEKERAAEIANAANMSPGEGARGGAGGAGAGAGGAGGDANRRGGRGAKPNMLRLRSSPSMMQRSPHKAGNVAQPHQRRASTPLYAGPSSRFDGPDSPAGSTSTKRGFAKRQHSMLVGLDMLGLLDPDETPTTSWQDIPSTVNVPRRNPRDKSSGAASVSSMSVGSAGSIGHASDPEDSDTEQSSHTSTEAAASSNVHWVCKECTYSNAGSFLRHQRCRMCGRAAADTGSVPAADGSGAAAAADPSIDRKKSRKKPRSRKSSNADRGSGEWSGRASNRGSHSSTEGIAVRKRVERKSSGAGSRSGKRSDRAKSSGSSSRQSQSPQRINQDIGGGRGSGSPREASGTDAAASASVTAPSVAEDATAVSKSGESSEEKFKRFLEENNLVVP